MTTEVLIVPDRIRKINDEVNYVEKPARSMHNTSMLRIALMQFEPVFGEVERNLRRIESLCEGIDAHLFVLPELCTTGYQFRGKDELVRLAEGANGRSISFLATLAAEKNCCFVIGFAEATGAAVFNSAALVGPAGCLGVYRKSHLFGREKELFQPGDTGFRVFETPRARVGVMICFDWIFPEAARTLALEGAQIIAHPANLVLPYCQQAMYARAVENRVFTATCNRIGSETRWPGNPLRFTGASLLLGPDGTILAEAGPYTEQVLVAEIEPTIADDKHITDENHLFADRRPPLYRRLTQV